MNSDTNSVTMIGELPLMLLAGFAVAWANDPDTAGKRVSAWVEDLIEHQVEYLDDYDQWLEWSPKTFPKGGQASVMRWLNAVLRGLSKELRAELSKEAATVVLESTLRIVNGTLVAIPTRVIGSPKALAAVGAMALASPTFRGRFGQCEWCRCTEEPNGVYRRLFFLVPTVRPGTRNRFCPGRRCGPNARAARNRSKPKTKKR